jgi:hypothetical protein
MATLDPARNGSQYDEHEYEELLDLLRVAGVAYVEGPHGPRRLAGESARATRDEEYDDPPVRPPCARSNEWVPGRGRYLPGV